MTQNIHVYSVVHYSKVKTICQGNSRQFFELNIITLNPLGQGDELFENSEK